MKITFWTDIADCGDHPEREISRLYCWAAACERLGHQVALWPLDHIDSRWGRYVRNQQFPAGSDATIMLASAVERRKPREISGVGLCVIAQPVGRIVLTETAWDADFIIGSPNDTLPPYMEFAAPRIQRLGRRYLGVHFPPFGRTLDLFERNGDLDFYLADDLDFIRAKYGGAGKLFDIGYRGNTVNEQTPGHPSRSMVFAHYINQPHFEFQYARDASWYDRTAEYLQFMSECMLTMAIVGDRVKTHRHVEAPMMGSPVCVVKQQLDVDPIHNGNNSVLLDDWFDERSAVLGLNRDYSALLVANDAAYRQGWSLRGQMRTLMERIEECVSKS